MSNWDQLSLKEVKQLLMNAKAEFWGAGVKDPEVGPANPDYYRLYRYYIFRQACENSILKVPQPPVGPNQMVTWESLYAMNPYTKEQVSSAAIEGVRKAINSIPSEDATNMLEWLQQIYIGLPARPLNCTIPKNEMSQIC